MWSNSVKKYTKKRLVVDIEKRNKFRPTLGHYRGDSLTHPMFITAYYIFDSGVTGSLVERLGP